MTAPAFFFTGCCFGKVPFDKTNRPENKFKTGNHLFFIAPCIDALLSLSCLAVGILGITNVISIPAASLLRTSWCCRSHNSSLDCYDYSSVLLTQEIV